jgi:hypothetical protein
LARTTLARVPKRASAWGRRRASGGVFLPARPFRWDTQNRLGHVDTASVSKRVHALSVSTISCENTHSASRKTRLLGHGHGRGHDALSKRFTASQSRKTSIFMLGHDPLRVYGKWMFVFDVSHLSDTDINFSKSWSLCCPRVQALRGRVCLPYPTSFPDHTDGSLQPRGRSHSAVFAPFGGRVAKRHAALDNEPGRDYS